MTGTRRLRVWTAVFLAVAFAAIVDVAGAEPSPALDGLQKWLDGTRDLECRFEQTLLSGAFGAGIRETGRLYLKRPGMMRWEYTRPDPKVALLHDGTASLYLPEDRQLIRGDAAWSSSPILRLLSGEGRLLDLFDVAPPSADDAGGVDVHRLRLTPRDRDPGFEQVTVTLLGPEFSISEAEVLDDAGNRMIYRFGSLKRNQGIGDERFTLDPPPGTEILGPS